MVETVVLKLVKHIALEVLAAAVLLMGILVLAAAVAAATQEVLDQIVIVIAAAAAVPTTMGQINLVLAVFGKAMDRWLLPIALVSALNLRLWWPITVTWILPLLQEPITPMAAAAPWKLPIFP